MRLRQVALVAQDLDPAVSDLTRLLGIKVAFNDPGVGKFGLENAVMAIGDTFLEVVSPIRAGTTAGRLLEKRGGDGGYMVLLQVDDIIPARARLDATGVRIVQEARGARFDMLHLHPKDIGGAIVSFDQMKPPEHWEWGGSDWKETVDTGVCTAITGVEIQSDAPATMAARWAEVLGETTEPRDGGFFIRLADGLIRFVQARDGRGEGVSAFDVTVQDRAAFLSRARDLGFLGKDGSVTACGTRIHPRAT